jgi:polysaccharide biosynthesis/export protein
MAERVSVVGLGKLGACLAACLADKGFSVVGVDADPRVVDLLHEGKAPVQEANLDSLIGANRKNLTATRDLSTAKIPICSWRRLALMVKVNQAGRLFLQVFAASRLGESRFLIRVGAGLVFLLIPFGLKSQDVKVPSVQPTSEPDVGLAETPATDAPTGYVIAPQDVLDVDVFDYPELTRTVRVSSDGTIGLPLLGQLRAVGLTVEALRKDIAGEYSKAYLKDPQITVAVKEAHGQPVSVIGAVDKPGIYELGATKTLIGVLSLAGGPGKFAGRTVLVTRPGGFGPMSEVEGLRRVAEDQVEVNLNKLLYAHANALNLEIKRRDTISVTRADIIYVAGAVRSPAGFALMDRDSVTVLQALAMAGGVGPSASKKRARIIRRGPDGSVVEIPLDLGKVLKGKARDITMAANDILFVPDSAGKAAAKRGAEGAFGVISGLIVYGRI